MPNMTMLERKRVTEKYAKNCVNVQKEDSFALPSGAVLSDFLARVEIELQKKELIQPYSEACPRPIHFLAETEQNAFLWKSGLSILERDSYEFWMDVPALLNKRLEQLTNFSEENPFMNPLWGLETPPSPKLRELEQDYLLSFARQFERTGLHLHALSLASSEALGHSELQRVLLPSSK